MASVNALPDTALAYPTLRVKFLEANIQANAIFGRPARFMSF
jgi:hypothetical protein